MIKRHYIFRKDGCYITLNNGFILLGCVLGNLIQNKYVPALILAPFSLLMFILAYVAHKYGK